MQREKLWRRNCCNSTWRPLVGVHRHSLRAVCAHFSKKNIINMLY